MRENILKKQLKGLRINLGDKVDLTKLKELLSKEKQLRSNYLRFNRLLKQIVYKVVIDNKVLTALLSYGSCYKFKYLGFDRSHDGASGQRYQLLDMQTEKIYNIDQNEPITPLDEEFNVVKTKFKLTERLKQLDEAILIEIDITLKDGDLEASLRVENIQSQLVSALLKALNTEL